MTFEKKKLTSAKTVMIKIKTYDFAVKLYRNVQRLLIFFTIWLTLGGLKLKAIINRPSLGKPETKFFTASPFLCSRSSSRSAHTTHPICHTINISAYREYEHTSLSNNNKAFKKVCSWSSDMYK